jgi:hypothetical protein
MPGTIKITQKGDFSKVVGFLEKGKRAFKQSILDKYGKLGVEALSAATPVDTGLTAQSWSYSTEITKGRATITFHNSNVQNYVNIAIILDAGHATGGGGWVQGRNYISPTIQPLLDELANEAWKEVSKT